MCSSKATRSHVRPLGSRTLVLAVLVMGLWGQGRATILRSRSIRALAQSSDLVVLGKISSVSSQWRGSRIFTKVRVEVSDQWLCRTKNQGNRPWWNSNLCRRRTLQLWTLGGKVGKIEQRVFGAARVHLGAMVVLFLSARRGGLFITGMTQGLFEITRQAGKLWAVRRLGHVHWQGMPPQTRLRLDHLEALVRKTRGTHQGRWHP